MIEVKKAGNATRLWQLISQGLPVGAYSYSQGLEYAVEQGWVDTEDTALDWILGQLLHAQATLDVAVLKRLCTACEDCDYDAFCYWNRFLLAARETSELLYEDEQMGRALGNLLQSLNITLPEHWPALPGRVSFIAMFALAAGGWRIDCELTASGYLWSWCENQVMAAVKLIPLGQTSGQRMLLELADNIEAALEKGFELEDDEIGQLNPGFALGSALHETQYTRLFRS
jgi:urease accessory protein